MQKAKVKKAKPSKHLGLIGEGEEKRVDFPRGKKEKGYNWLYCFFDWTNNEVYRYNRTGSAAGDIVIVAKKNNKKLGKRQQVDFHKYCLGYKQYKVGDKVYEMLDSHFRNFTILEMITGPEKVAVMKAYHRQYG